VHCTIGGGQLHLVSRAARLSSLLVTLPSAPRPCRLTFFVGPRHPTGNPPRFEPLVHGFSEGFAVLVHEAQFLGYPILSEFAP
ncbi:MAG: hypothetical protein M3522_06200, partial [Actinomycetota bacterium]|nr:hypothetical protein [Actinomycetota bacterium]